MQRGPFCQPPISFLQPFRGGATAKATFSSSNHLNSVSLPLTCHWSLSRACHPSSIIHHPSISLLSLLVILLLIFTDSGNSVIPLNLS